VSTATAPVPPHVNPFEVEATNSGGASGEMPPEGNHPAVLIGLIDLGTHRDEYQGQENWNRKVLFCWELPAEVKSDGSPHVLTQDYNVPPKLSGKSKLRSMIEGWRGRAMEDAEKLDMVKMVGASCLINVGRGKSKKGSEYAQILGITPVIKGMQAPRPFNPPFVWAFGMGEFSAPSWLPYLYGRPVEEHIAESTEAKGGRPAPPAAASEDNDDPCPF
jgi:hypothetical protein